MPQAVRRIRVGDRVTIYPRGKKKIDVADFFQDRKHHRLSLETGNQKVATQKAVALDASLTTETFKAPPPPTTVAQAVSDYVEFLRTEGRARKTIVRYQGELGNFRDTMTTLHVTRLAQISPTHCAGRSLGSGMTVPR